MTVAQVVGVIWTVAAVWVCLLVWRTCRRPADADAEYAAIDAELTARESADRGARRVARAQVRESRSLRCVRPISPARGPGAHAHRDRRGRA